MPTGLEDWLRRAPKVDTDWHELRQVYRRSLVDLAALRFYPESVPDSSLPAAGLPWFMALFGRDSLITSYQAMPFVPELARTTLLALGAHQATDLDDFRDAEPGKILHELRHGELAHFGERPHSPYFGSADATPLFLVVLDEYERWTGDVDTVRALEGAARAALDWIEQYGDLDGDGYIEYQTRNPRTGLVNQCWKDSCELDRAPRRHAGRPAARGLRDPGVRLRRAGPYRPAGPRGLGRPGAGRPAGAGRGATAGQLRPRLLAAGRRLLRAGPGRRQASRCRRSPPTSATCCGAASCRTSGSTAWSAPDRRRSCSPAGACARWPTASRPTTRSSTTTARSGRTTPR